jgi:hypothetical protein
MILEWRRWRVSKKQVFGVVKSVAPPYFAVLVLAILVLISPVAKAIGDNAFLVLTYLHLFFYPHGGVSSDNVCFWIGHQLSHSVLFNLD